MLEVLAVNPVLDFEPVMLVLMLTALVFDLLLVLLADESNLKIKEVNPKCFFIYLQIYFSILLIFGLKNLVKTKLQQIT